MESEFRYGEQIRYGRSKTLRRGLRSACFSRKKRQENGTDTEKLRRLQNSTDSSAILFLVQKGPLGKPRNPSDRKTRPRQDMRITGFIVLCCFSPCAGNPMLEWGSFLLIFACFQRLSFAVFLCRFLPLPHEVQALPYTHRPVSRIERLLQKRTTDALNLSSWPFNFMDVAKISSNCLLCWVLRWAKTRVFKLRVLKTLACRRNVGGFFKH